MRRGFTLFELLVTFSILVFLISLVTTIVRHVNRNNECCPCQETEEVGYYQMR
jgi:prepilin-type N-terminal cleavage/methylation domain-containing protein